MKSILISLTLALILGLAMVSGSMAGGNYHGHGMGMREMSDMDSNDDGAISFEEFKAPTVERLKGGFDMLDTDNDGEIDQKEWDNYLRFMDMRYHPKVNEFAIIITKGEDDSQGLIEKGFNSPP